MADITNWLNVNGIAASGSSVMGGTFWVIGALVLFALVGGVCWMVIYRRKFNVFCRILSLREGDTGKYLEDKGAFITRKDKSKVFRLLKNKCDLPQPAFKFLMPVKKGNVIFLKQTGTDTFIPVLPSEIFGEQHNSSVKVMAPEIEFWRIVASDRARIQYFKPGFWQSPLGGMTMLAVTGIIIFLLVYMVLTKQAAYTNALAETSKNFVLASENFKLAKISSTIASTTAQAVNSAAP
jgi:hypothetical protein